MRFLNAVKSITEEITLRNVNQSLVPDVYRNRFAKWLEKGDERKF